MTRSLEVKEGEIFRDKAGLEVKVERIDPNHRIRFSVVGDQDTSAGPGEMSYDSFVSRFSPSNQDSNHYFSRRKAA
jgi:hypothetical protein